MPCIKTGCHVYIAEYGEWAYGDAFQFGSLHAFRICEVKPGPIMPARYHFEIKRIAQWFDRGREPEVNSTLLAYDVIDFGYEGIALPEEWK